jgi:MoxR-like ATPase
MTKAPSIIARDALRAAIRRHPDAAAVLNGRIVSDLSKVALQEVADALGVVLAPDDTSDAVDVSDESDTTDNVSDTMTDTVETELKAVRDKITQGGFSVLDDVLRDLVREARKPAVIVEVPVEVPVSGNGRTMPAVTHSKPTGTRASWNRLFSVRGDLGQRESMVWDGGHPDTPKIDGRYVWPQPQTAIALAQIARKRNVMLYGAAGTGKTAWAEQLAAKLGRPFALISCDNSTDGPTLVGMTVPSSDGSVVWQDGQLTRAIQTPGCVVCLDEPSVARPGALFVMQNVLANRVLFIGETGRRVKVAEGVIFLTTDNTNGMGGGGRRGYTDTNRLNAAFLDRFGVRIQFDYMPAAKEAALLVTYTGCTRELADLLVNTAITTRASANNQQITSGIGFRRLLSWAENLIDGIDPEDAFNATVLNCAAEQDVEALRQQCLLSYDRNTVALALNPGSAPAVSVPDGVSDPAISNPSIAGRAAAQAFKGV